MENIPLEFNLSHSGDYAICAISDDEVGCDIEKIKDVNLKIAKRFFSEEEYNNVLKDNKLFFRYWTLKESYLKAKGIGIKGLDNAKIDIESLTLINDDKYHLYELNIIDGYNIALCLSNNENYEYKIITSVIIYSINTLESKLYFNYTSENKTGK